MKTIKVGNTVLRLNESRAVKTEAEKQAILDEIGEIVYKAIVEKAIREAKETA